MTRTIFEKKNKMFTDKAHLAAQKFIYPNIFKCSSDELIFKSMEFEKNAEDRILDGQMGVDIIIGVKIEKLKAPLEFMIQERFRHMEYAGWGDLTITEWNNASDLPSELYKIKASLFVYGYYDEKKETFGEVIAINVTDLLLALVSNSIEWRVQKNKKKQTFLGFTFDKLDNAGVVRWWKKV